MMQDELVAENLATKIRIGGINIIGSELGNTTITTGRDLFWLQDTAAEHVWTQLQIQYRDVLILDGENRPVDVYNLTDPAHNLALPAAYAELKSLLKQAAGE
jgi:hypothetical protein